MSQYEERNTILVSVRLTPDLVRLIDEEVARRRRSGRAATRSSVMRSACEAIVTPQPDMFTRPPVR